MKSSQSRNTPRPLIFIECLMKNGTTIATLLLAASALLFVAGCAGPEKLSVTSSIPSAEGSVECDKASNGNTSIDLKVKHLASPDRLTPPASVYVVWLKTDKDAPPQNIGALEVDKNLNGRLKTVTSQRRFELSVTGEGSGQATAPSGKPLMWANCSR